MVLVKKVREAVGFMALHIIFSPLMPHEAVMIGPLSHRSPLVWFPYLILALVLVRCQYYFAWTMGIDMLFVCFAACSSNTCVIFSADAIHNAAGMGYDDQVALEQSANGELMKSSVLSEYDADCERWSLIRNVCPMHFEVSDSWKVSIDSWNISTLRWLRRVAYERLHVR